MSETVTLIAILEFLAIAAGMYLRVDRSLRALYEELER